MISIYNKLSDYIIIINNTGQISFCNESFLNKFNYKNEDILNLNISKITNNIELNNILKESKEISTILEIYSKNNKLIKVKCNISKINSDDNIIIIGQEVNSKPYTIQMLEDILDSIDNTVFVIDSEEKYVYVNNAFEKTFNKKREEVIGTYNYEHWDEDTYIQLRKNNKEVIKIKKPKLFNQKLKFKNNTYLVESYRCPVFDKDDNLKYIVGSTKNISLERVVSEELYQSYNKLLGIDYINDFLNNGIDLERVFNNIAKSVLDYTGADGVTIWLYDKERKGLTANLRLNNSNMHIDNEQFIPLEDENINLLTYDNNFNRMLSRKEINKNYLMDNNYLSNDYLNSVSHHGGYKIVANGELIGVIGINYKNDNIPKFNCDEYMQYICNRIAIIVKFFNLSEEKDIQSKKRIDTEKELEQYLNISVDIVSKIGSDGTIKSISPNCYNTLGWTAEELLSLSIEDIVHPDDLDFIKGRDRFNYINGKFNRQVSRLKHKYGHYIYIEWSSTYMTDERVYITTGRDITKRLKMEEEMKQLEEVVKLETVKNEFLSNMSHEFRTPINIILGTMQVMDMNIEKNNIEIDSLKRYTNYIKQNSYRLLRLVNNLIDINKMDVGLYELKCSNNDIVSIIEDITLSVSDYIKNNKINLIFDTNIEEVITYCDPNKIERIMLNLLSNAIKYTEDDGLIEVNIDANEYEIVVSVKDTGIGIPKDKLEFIFDRFCQVDDSLNRICEGSGIGLSLVKNLVEMHGGSVSVNSKVNEGSEFIFSIPIVLGEDIVIKSNIDRKVNHVERCNIEFSDIYS